MFIFRDPHDSRLFVIQKPDEKAYQQSLYQLSLFEEQKTDFKKFFQQPINTTLLGFSKVTNMFLDAVNYQDSAGSSPATPSKSLINKSYKSEISDDGISNLLDSISPDNIHTTNNEGFEVVTRVDLGPMPKIERARPIDEKDFEFDKDGRLLRVDEIKRKIFRGVSFVFFRILFFIYFVACLSR